MAKLVLSMTMSLDGFFSGPDGELDWMAQAPDPEFSRDNVSFFDRFDRGFIGYPAASAPPRPSSGSGLWTNTSSPCTRWRSAAASGYSPARPAWS